MTEDSITTEAPEQDTVEQTPDLPDTSAQPSDTGAPATEPNGPLSQPDTSSPDPVKPDPTAAARQQGVGAPGPQAAAPQKPVDWQARYKEVQSYNDRRFTQMKSEMEQLRQFKAEQERKAQEANIRPWSPRHPLHSKFQGVLSKAQYIQQSLRSIDPNLPPEAQQAAKQAIMSQMTPEEQGIMQQYQQESQQFQRDFFSDPQNAIAPLVQPLIQQAIQQYVESVQAKQSVAKDFEDPALKPLLEQHGEEIQTMLNDGVPYDYAMHQAKMFGEVQRLRAELDGLRKRAGQGEAQQRLVRQQATISADPRVSDTPDVYKLARAEAAKQGIDTANPKFMQILADVQAKVGR